MTSPWAVVDQLMRELGSLRDDARGLPRTLSDSVTAEVDWLIAMAAQAVDETVPAPDDETNLRAACEAIVEARERIGDLRRSASRSAANIRRSIELRRQSARVLYEAIRTMPRG
jgi:hypothetical protein